MIKLTQEQVENLERYYELKSKECNTMREMNKETSKPITCDAKDGYDSTDGLTKFQKEMAEASKRLAEFVKDNSIVITEVNNEKIDIGTTFIATIEFDGRVTTTTKTLVETILPSDDHRKYVSLESAVGKEILGRKASEKFEYTQYGNKITMMINEIVSSKKLTR